MSIKRSIAIKTFPLRNGFVEIFRMKFGILSPSQKQYHRQISASGLFDPHHYNDQTRRSLIARLMPLRHFILRGEKLGLQPSAKFDPESYLRANPDVRDLRICPLRHYLEYGKEENRPLQMPLIARGEVCLTKLPIIRKPLHHSGRRIAVSIQLFYYDLWEEMLASIRNLQTPFDLFVTITIKDDFDEILARVKADVPDAMVVGIPNHGRDIFPFMHLLNAGVFDEYDAVCKLHSKKSPHRQDGHVWRDHLIRSILPGDGKADLLVERILADPALGFVVADGQVFSEEKWWGSNRSRTRDLLLNIGIDIREMPLRFPAGSIYWVTAPVLRTLRGLNLQPWHFEVEGGQLDSTLAHVIERAMGFIAAAGKLRIDQVTEVLGSAWVQPAARQGHRPAINAFYLPQFHPIPENDAWWGKGFTEWHNVTRRTINFQGHQQPRLPGELGFYDLRLPEILDQQGRLARANGIDAFCVYHYWFDGKRLLEKPLEIVLGDASIDFPFFLCWANEKWTRSWDGISSDVLMDQSYADGFEESFAEDLVRYFRDRRYQTHEGKPKFIIYRPHAIPHLSECVARLRKAIAARGFPEIHLGAGMFHAAENDAGHIADLFDFFVEIPPHGLVDEKDYLFGGPPVSPLYGEKDPPAIRPEPGFRGLVYNYNAAAENSLQPGRYPDAIHHKLRRGLMLGWDNTPRRGREAHIAFGCNPASFHYWFRMRIAEAARSGQPELYINAWNEWAEGTVLEPDQQFHDAYLRSVRSLAGPVGNPPSTPLP